MTGFRSLYRGEPRPPTWIERERSAILKERGVESVYLEPEKAPQGFWTALVLLTTNYLTSPTSGVWQAWTEEMAYNDLPLLGETKFSAYTQIVQVGGGDPAQYVGGPRDPVPVVSVGVRLSAIEHLLDVLDDEVAAREFADGVEDRARFYRVGLRLEGRRFIPASSEHLHREIVEPTLVLLSDESYSDIDRLYRKAFDRLLSRDPSGAITAAISAVEEMLRFRMPSMKGQTLSPLAEKARAEGIITPAVEEFIKKLYALRPDSDAHAGGTSDYDLAMLALHLTGSLLLYLTKT